MAWCEVRCSYYAIFKTSPTSAALAFYLKNKNAGIYIYFTRFNNQQQNQVRNSSLKRFNRLINLLKRFN